jgi:hypothetical protein
MSLMMMKTNPITPPRELVREWYGSEDCPDGANALANYLCTQAAQWGADQELEACCDHMRDHQWGFVERPDGTKIHRAIYLQQSRRPKPPSLKEQALNDLDDIPTHDDEGRQVVDLSNIRRALEALPND